MESTDVNLYFSLRLDFAGGHIRVKRSSDAVTPSTVALSSQVIATAVVAMLACGVLAP